MILRWFCFALLFVYCITISLILYYTYLSLPVVLTATSGPILSLPVSIIPLPVAISLLTVTLVPNTLGLISLPVAIFLLPADVLHFRFNGIHSVRCGSMLLIHRPRDRERGPLKFVNTKQLNKTEKLQILLIDVCPRQNFAVRLTRPPVVRQRTI